MKLICLLFALCITKIFGQTPQQSIAKIKTVNQAFTFIKKNKKLNGAVKTFINGSDTLSLHKLLYLKKRGETLVYKNNIYKILEDTTAGFLRVSYIYLRGDVYNKTVIDSIRNNIMQEHTYGIAFNELVAAYNMDVTSDVGWFLPGAMMKPFTDEVLSHNTGDVFTVDVPENKWYYVVRKTYPLTELKQITVLSLPLK